MSQSLHFSAIVDTIRDNVFDNVLLFTKVFLHFRSKSSRLSRYIISLCKNIIDTLKNDYIIIRKDNPTDKKNQCLCRLFYTTEHVNIL